MGMKSLSRTALKSPHPEKVIWNEHTKNYIQGAIERAAQDAANVISEQLDEEDFLTWVKKCSEVIYKNTGNDSVLRQLGEMVDKEKSQATLQRHQHNLCRPWWYPERLQGS